LRRMVPKCSDGSLLYTWCQNVREERKHANRKRRREHRIGIGYAPPRPVILALGIGSTFLYVYDNAKSPFILRAEMWCGQRRQASHVA